MEKSTSPREAAPRLMGTLVLLAFASVACALPWLEIRLYPLGWVGLALMLHARLRVQGAVGFLLIYAASATSLAIAFHWAPGAMAYTMQSSIWVGLIVAVVLLSMDALRLALPLWLAPFLTRTPATLWLMGGLLAVVCEAWLKSVFPWKIGYFQIGWSPLVQVADLFGPGITSFAAYAGAGCLLNLAYAVRPELNQRIQAEETKQTQLRRAKLWAWAPAVVMLAVVGYGLAATSVWKHRIQVAEKIHVGLVQAYPSRLESVELAQQLTSQLPRDVDLVCWPESIGGTYEMDLAELSNAEKVFQNSRAPSRGLQPWPQPRCPLLVGGKSYRGNGEVPELLHTSAFLLGIHEEIIGRYHKRYLMPFGEYVPLKESLPYMEELFGTWDEITPGGEPQVLTVGHARIGTMLCYEDMIPEAARSVTAQNANLLISLADGSAFESPYTLLQHRMLAQLRAVENRRYLLRCASTGETCVISPLGEIIERLPLQQDLVLNAEVALLDEQSIYSRWGEFFPYVCFASLATMAVLQTRRRSR